MMIGLQLSFFFDLVIQPEIKRHVFLLTHGKAV